MQIKERLIQEELKESYIDYAMSVIMQRALPDVRDGLKPVHRRILYAMYGLGLVSNKPHKKCARVVGEVLGKYHPHGDQSVYDALVRMAQSFSLRYMLVDGQGNFGCFTSDTKVKLVDGRNLSFKELIEEDKQGKKNFTFTINEKGKVKVAEIKNPRLTKKNTEIMKIVLDNGEEIKCTLNHKFMLKGGDYKEARDLKSQDSIMPCYLKLSNKKDDPKVIGYDMVFQPNLNSWDFVHVLSDEWNIKNNIYNKSTGRIRHHIDFNKLNNYPDNIKRMHWKEHWKTHYDFTSEKHKNDAEYRKRLVEGRTKFWSNKQNREDYSKRMRERNLENWKKEDYREKMRITLSEVNKKYLAEHPERIEEIRKRASLTLKRLWKIPKYRNLYHEKIVASNKRRKTNLTGRKKFINICEYLRDNNISLDKENYEKVRKEIFETKSFTSWDLGINKYFENNRDLLLCELNGNHKIAKVELLKENADVYDLTIDNTHNFALASGVFVHNSVDGDSAAAMRYTESKLRKIAEDLLNDIEKNTVDFIPNFDNSLKEPVVLPAKVPNLLINGASGIAVGMATNIPPHNISEVINAVIYALENESSVEELMKFIKGPDFPTGASILGYGGIKQAYKTGKGKVKVRSKVRIEDNKIIVYEIPYMVNKSLMLQNIANLVKDKRIVGISDLRDESSRNEIRVVIELKKGANTEVVLNNLYKNTSLETTFGINMVALYDGQPKLMNLKELIDYFIGHRKDVVTKRTQFDLDKAEARKHILEGILIALENIDSVVELIKKSKNVLEAKEKLVGNYELSEKQALAILDMKLSRLTNLEQDKIKEENIGLVELIKELKEILESEDKLKDIIKKELEEISKVYSDERRTEILDVTDEIIEDEDLIKEENVVITFTNEGYIKSTKLEEYKQQKRGGKGSIATTTKDSDFVKDLFVCSNLSNILLFTNKGRIHWMKAYQIPAGSKYSKGKAVVNLVSLGKDERISSILSLKDFREGYLIFCTKNGILKKTDVKLYSKPRKGGINAIGLKEDDEVVEVLFVNDGEELVIGTKNGLGMRFNEIDVKSVGRGASGVIGIRLNKDYVVGMVRGKGSLFSVTENGYGKRTLIEDYRLVHRGSKGVLNIKTKFIYNDSRNEKVVGVKNVFDDDELMFITQNGVIIRVKVSQFKNIGRNTSGIRLIKLGESDKVVSIAKVVNGE